MRQAQLPGLMITTAQGVVLTRARAKSTGSLLPLEEEEKTGQKDRPYMGRRAETNKHSH
jgi:hypothetical protein